MKVKTKPKHIHFIKIKYEDGKLVGRCKCGFSKEYDPDIEPRDISLKGTNLDWIGWDGK